MIYILILIIANLNLMSNENTRRIGLSYNVNNNTTNSELTNRNSPLLVDFDTKVTSYELKNNFDLFYDYKISKSNKIWLGLITSYSNYDIYYKNNENLRYYFNSSNNSISPLDESNNININLTIIEISPKISIDLYDKEYFYVNIGLIPKFIFPMLSKIERYAKIENSDNNYYNNQTTVQMDKSDIAVNTLSFGSEINLNFGLNLSKMIKLKMEDDIYLNFAMAYSNNFTSILENDKLFYQNYIFKTSLIYSF